MIGDWTTRGSNNNFHSMERNQRHCKLSDVTAKKVIAGNRQQQNALEEQIIQNVLIKIYKFTEAFEILKVLTRNVQASIVTAIAVSHDALTGQYRHIDI